MPTSQDQLQNFKNHGRFDPPMHFFVVPVLLINVLVMSVSAVHHLHRNLPYHLWLVAVSIALLVLAINSRVKDLKVQDRVIRIEEQVRYAALLSPADLAVSQKLSLPQIVALRFASDAELPALIHRAVAEGLKSKQIKQSIVDWRADTHRV